MDLAASSVAWYLEAFVKKSSTNLPPTLAAFGGARATPPGTGAVLLRPIEPRRPVERQPINPVSTAIGRTVPLYVDLHSHTTASDGTDAPSALVRKAKAAGLSALAITDHDTVAGIDEAAHEAQRLGLDFLPGIEISAAYPRPGVMHLLGYGIDPANPTLLALIGRLQEARHERNQFLVNELNAVGVHVSFEELIDIARGSPHSPRSAEASTDPNDYVIGRPHFAKLLFIKGYIPNMQAAYKYYLGNTGRFRFDRNEPEPAEAISAVHAAGGLVSLAHPNQLRKSNFAQLANEVETLAAVGLDAIEVVYNDHRESFIVELKELCRRHNLLTTGGSDYHGSCKKWIVLGRCGMRRRVPRKYYDRLLGRLQARQAA